MVKFFEGNGQAPISKKQKDLAVKSIWFVLLDFISKKYQPEIHTVFTSLILIFNISSAIYTISWLKTDYVESQAIKTWISKTTNSEMIGKSSIIAPFSKSYSMKLIARTSPFPFARDVYFAQSMREYGRTCNRALITHDALRSAVQPRLVKC